MDIERLIIGWQRKALELHRGSRTKELLARAAVYEECAEALSAIRPGTVEETVSMPLAGVNAGGPTTVSIGPFPSPTTAE